jgi:uncharacterized membrane protein
MILFEKLLKDYKREKHLLSLAKAISWRIVGTSTTTIISFLITNRWEFALSIGFIEVFAKIALFYFHDRIWERFR